MNDRRVALLTGATGGIGRVTAARLAGLGYAIAAHYAHRVEQAQTLLRSLPGSGHVAVRSDLADANAPARLVEEVISTFGHIDLLVNNAGIYVSHDPNTTDHRTWQSAWHTTLAVNLLAPAHLVFSALPHFPARGGKIINVSSRGAYRGEPEAPAYGASKGGLNSMTQSLARALGSRGIMVYGVAPGWVETDMAEPYLSGAGGDEIRAQSPLARVARPEEIAATIAFLAGDDTDYLTGAVIDVNGASYLR